MRVASHWEGQPETSGGYPHHTLTVTHTHTHTHTTHSYHNAPCTPYTHMHHTLTHIHHTHAPHTHLKNINTGRVGRRAENKATS